jgi:L-fuconate dehydratase
MPLWRLLLSLSPKELVATLDLSHIEDEMTAEQAAELLESCSAGRCERESALAGSYPGYDTSFGWISLSDEEVRAGAVRARDAGFKALKLKVGSKDPERDVRRALLVREAVGDDLDLAVDANQQWSLATAITMCTRMAPARLLWVEEPCHADDIAAHRKLHETTGATVAVGEAIPNRVVFKNFLSAGACQLAQLDPARQAGISECIVIAMMAVRRSIRVTHHVGDMGSVAQHLMPFYRVALNQPDGVFLEHIPHLNQYFVYPPVVKAGAYSLPTSGAVGASMELKPSDELLAIGRCTAADVTIAEASSSAAASSAASV